MIFVKKGMNTNAQMTKAMVETKELTKVKSIIEKGEIELVYVFKILENAERIY